MQNPYIKIKLSTAARKSHKDFAVSKSNVSISTNPILFSICHSRMKKRSVHNLALYEANTVILWTNHHHQQKHILSYTICSLPTNSPVI